MECPICGLINPESAQRCDCGYNFDKGTMEKPYYIQKPPEDFKSLNNIYIILHFIFFTIYIGCFLIFFLLWVGNAPPLLVILSIISIIVTYCCFYYFLYLQLKKRKNWARITLVIITFTYGTFYFNSQELKLYCLQKEGLEKKR